MKQATAFFGLTRNIANYTVNPVRISPGLYVYNVNFYLCIIPVLKHRTF